MKDLSATTMLIVEDEPAWQDVLNTKIGKDYTCQTVSSGETCIEKIHSLQPDIVILDHDLAGQLDGLQTLKQIRKLSPKTTVIMFSGQENVQRAVDILNSGAYDYVVKGDNAILRVKNILKNIREQERLRAQVIEMYLKIRRWQIAMAGLLGIIFIMSIIFYLFSCPQKRLITWDPFNVSQENACTRK